MNKKLYTLVSVILASTLSLSSIISFELNNKTRVDSVKNSTADLSLKKDQFTSVSQTLAASSELKDPASQNAFLEILKSKIEQDLGTKTSTVTDAVQTKVAVTNSVASVQAENSSAAKTTSYSRGGQAPEPRNTSAKLQADSSESKIELLDWWKEARYVFSIDTVATVTDVSTGKSFKVKRTLGTNHADSEALTKEDTQIIKSIWGGFSWDRRPVIVNVDGRRLAASMSAMPHAGLDSAPAYATINNRSGGYGRGQNLDVIKNNGMDGHFDIHFLNSTRHMDGKEDPQHQAAILKAAGK